MKSLRTYFSPLSATTKSLFILLLVGFTIFSCEKEDPQEEAEETQENLNGYPGAASEDYESDWFTDPPASASNTPMVVDLSENEMMPPIKQQLVGSCSSYATAYYMMSYYEHIETGLPYDESTILLSPSYVFNQVNLDDNDCSDGSYLADNLTILQDQGVCTLSEMPITSDCSAGVTADQSASAAAHKISSFHLMYHAGAGNLNPSHEILRDGIKAHLLNGTPVIIGYESGQDFATNGYISSNTLGYSIYNQSNFQSQTPASHHASLIVGYDEGKNAFKVINSWGTNWGDQGYFYFDYTLFEQIIDVVYVAFDAPSPSLTVDISNFSHVQSYNFGQVEVGECVTQSIALTNDHDHSITIHTNTSNTGFDSNLDFTLSAGQTVFIPVTFCPNSSVPYFASLVIEVDGTSEAIWIDLNGSGVSGDSEVGQFQFNNLTELQRYARIRPDGSSTWYEHITLNSMESLTYFNLEPGVYWYQTSSNLFWTVGGPGYGSGPRMVVAGATIEHDIID